MNELIKDCPRCGRKFILKLGSTSRRDNETMICSQCGIDEAMFDFLLHQSSGLSESERTEMIEKEKAWLTQKG